jgi:hypothetical protein
MLKWRAQQHSQPETTKRITRHWQRRLQSHTFGRGVRKVITENQLHSEHTTFIGCPNCWNNPMLGTKTACSYSSSPVDNKPYSLWLNYSLVHSYQLLWLLIWSAGLSVNLYMPSPFFSSPLGLGDFNLLEMYLHHSRARFTSTMCLLFPIQLIHLKTGNCKRRTKTYVVLQCQQWCWKSSPR